MVVGQKVKHSKSGECLTIKKINGNVAVCYVERPFLSNGILIDARVCLISNLNPNE